jgi:hypothetical protein
MQRTLIVVGGLGGLLLCAGGPSAASIVLPPVVNPATYESRSGDYVLEVDPSHRHGRGGASYRLSRGGREVWSGARPFTLLGAAVGEDGVVAGYAYSGGLEGFAADDTLHLLVLDPRGHVRRDDTTARGASPVIHGGPEPTVDGLVFQPGHDRVVFRVSTYEDPEVWKPYVLSTGKPVAPFRPRTLAPPEVRLWVVDAKPVAGTPLTLVHWGRDDWTKEEWGARFTLVDLRGKQVWMLDLPTDYQAPPGDRKARERLSNIGSKSAIRETREPGEFEVRLAGTSECVLHVAERAGRRPWRVRERSRRPCAADEAVADAGVLEGGPELTPRYLGAVRLGGEAGRRAIRDVHHFDLDASGRAGFARAEGQCEVTFVIAGTGDPPRETRLGELGRQCSWPLVAWAGGGSWLVTTNHGDEESRSTGWWIDASSGQARPLHLPRGISVEALANRPGGGAVLLGVRESTDGRVYSRRTVLVWIGAEGWQERAWGEGAPGGPSELPSADDVAVTSRGDVVLLEASSGTVVIFGPDGSRQGTIDLQDAWGRDPAYPTGVSRDGDGGFIVADFGSAVPLVRMRPDGTVHGALRPRYGDGRPAGRLFQVRAGPDGAIWASDGEALLRLDGEGVVEGAVGAEANSADLGDVAAITLGSGNRIYAADRRTGAVHVFGPDGQRDHVCRPGHDDVVDALQSPSLAATDDGRVYLRVEDGLGGNGVFLEFSPAGERTGRHGWADRGLLWNPATGGFWALNLNDIAALDGQGQPKGNVVARRADRKWLDWITGAVVAPDGALAVASRSSDFARDAGELALTLYSPDGTPAHTVRLPSADWSRHLAYDGRHVALWQAGEIWVLDATGTPVGRFSPRPGGRKASDWPLLITADGRELWMFDGAVKDLHRFGLP